MLQNDQEIPCNPLDPDGSLKAPSTEPSLHEISHPPQLPQVEDSAVTKAEKFERHGLLAGDDVTELPPSKRVKLDSDHSFNSGHGPTTSERQKGIAPIKAEYRPTDPYELVYRLTMNTGTSYIHREVGRIGAQLLLTTMRLKHQFMSTKIPNLVAEAVRKRRRARGRTPAATSDHLMMRKACAKHELHFRSFLLLNVGSAVPANMSMT